jgi:8-oxo-dGTP diphosphatase
MPESVVCVGAVVFRDAKLLLVRQATGHSLAGQWTIPWGRLDRGESPAAAALRETSEESSVVATLEGLLGVQELPPPWSGWIALIYQCRHADGEPVADGVETDAARYFSRAEFEALDEPIEVWSRWLVSRVFDGQTSLLRRAEHNPFGSQGFL